VRIQFGDEEGYMQSQQDETRPINSSDTGLYHRYAPVIFAYIYQHTVSREDAEDLTLEVFTAALERNNLSELPDGEKLLWLRRVAHNKLIDNYRRLKRRPVTTLEDAETDHFALPSPEQSALKQEEYQWLYKAIASLAPSQQMVLRLRYGNELRFDEIAVMLNKREGAVRKLLSRALIALRAAYETEKEGK
jgi:RNA polymerase sigma-70 factor, ECF subfamily